MPDQIANSGLASTRAPQLEPLPHGPACLVAVDIGNSGIKFGRFLRHELTSAGSSRHTHAVGQLQLPEPASTFELPIAHDTGLFDAKKLAEWCQAQLTSDTHWTIGSVHRGAAALLTATIAEWAQQQGIDWKIRRLSNQEVKLPIRVDEPARVGIDRLLAAVAANQLRRKDRPAIVVDLGTATTVDLVEADGAFAGGAILPGIGMASRALADQTDALPHIMLSHDEPPPAALGKSTKAAIEAGLYWGTVGAVGKLISQLAAGVTGQPDVFLTGGAASTIAQSIEAQGRVEYVPHLVLSGIALLESQNPSTGQS